MKILNDVFSVHLQNSNEIDYLEKYYKDLDDITKLISEED